MAFLSVRVTDDVRSRVKAVAAARGENLQDLIGTLLERFLEEADCKPPQLAGVLRPLRGVGTWNGHEYSKGRAKAELQGWGSPEADA